MSGEKHEKNNKSDKGTDKVDKEFLTKAKDSRDMIDKTLKTFENAIIEISDKIIKVKNKEGLKDLDESTILKLETKVSELQNSFEFINKKIIDKKEYVTELEKKISELEDAYNSKIKENQMIEEQLIIIRESKEKIDIEYQVLLKNNEQLIKTYENRQVDLIVLTDSTKEKVAVQDDLRTKITKLNKELEEAERKLTRQREVAEMLDQKLKTLKIENDFVRLSIDKNKIEYEHMNKLVQAKEEELKPLNDQLDKREIRLKEVENLIKEYREGFPEMENQKRTYEELIEKYKVQVTEKQQNLISIESRILDLNGKVESLQQHFVSKEDLIKVSERRLEDIKNSIDISIRENKEREERLVALTEKIDYLKPECDRLINSKEIIEKSINDSKTIFQNLKEELGSQEKEIRDKESRIHRLEVLSAIYRVSKFFGGILICFSIFLFILAISYIYNIVDLGIFNRDLIIFMFFLNGALLLIAGLFHLEKS